VIRAAVLPAAVLLLSGCGVRPTGVVYAGEAPLATASASPQTQVYFLSGGTPTPVRRSVGPGDPQLVFAALLKGPTPEERAKGLSTELTGIIKIAVHEVDGRTLLLETVPPAQKLSPAAFAQISCTAAALPDRLYLKISYLRGGSTPYESADCPQAGAPQRSLPYPPTG
jgi:hypothetical protein